MGRKIYNHLIGTSDELEFYQSSFKEYGIENWIMTIEDTTAIGSIGLLTFRYPFFDREILKKETGMVELILAVFPSFRRQGFVKEPIKAIIRYGFSVGFLSIKAIVDKPNIAAIRILEKASMKKFKSVTFKGQTIYIFYCRKMRSSKAIQVDG